MNKQTIIRTIISSCLTTLLLNLAACGGGNTTPTNPEENPSENQLIQPKDIQTYFNYPSPLNPASDLEQVILDFINAAEISIDLAVYDLDMESIATALAEAHNQGIKVRIVTDEDNLGTENQAAYSLLDQHQVPWIDDTADGSKGSGLMHNKFIIVDQTRVLTGSTNFTHSGIHGDLDEAGHYQGTGNVNNIVTIESPALAEIFTNEFNQYWGDGPGGELDSKFGLSKVDHSVQTIFTETDGIQIDVQFSPQSKTKYEGSTLETLENLFLSANERIYIAQFVFSAQVLADAMQTRALTGTEVKGLGDRSFFYRYFSEFLDLTGESRFNDKGEYETDAATGHLNNPWNIPAEAYHAIVSEHDKFHHKFFVVDDKVATGSHNASAAGAFANDDLVLIIHDEEIANKFANEFLSHLETARTAANQ